MSRPSPLSSFRIRPRFAHTIDRPLDAVREQLVQSLARQAPELVVKSFPTYVSVHIPESDRRAWSPRLALDLHTLPDGTTLVLGIYGPDAEVWSLFLYLYIGVGLLGIFGGILGYAQLYVGNYGWGYYVTGAAAIIAGGLYLLAQFGQKLGAAQTFRLHHAYEQALGQPQEVR